MQATLIAPIAPSRKCRNCSLIGFPLFCKAGIAGFFSGELLWRRSPIASGLAGNARMTAIKSARKRIRGNFDTGNSLLRNYHGRRLREVVPALHRLAILFNAPAATFPRVRYAYKADVRQRL
jgi:hypothetical protein